MKTIDTFYGPDLIKRMQEPLPKGYLTYRSCKEYFLRESGALGNLRAAGTPACPGARWHHGPFHFEKYVTDLQPPHDSTGPFRLCVWQPMTRLDKPQGWHRATQGMGLRMTGFAKVETLENGGWSSHARRHLSHFRKLLKSGEREIAEASMDEYLAAYAKADQDRTMKRFFPAILKEKARAHGQLFHLVVSRRRNGVIDAGFAFLDIPEARQSTHVSAFMAGEGKKDSASTGLIAYWFEECRKRNIPYADFGFFWAPGDPGDWKGFSRFKSQFGVRLIQYPKPLMRWFGKPFWKKS